MVDPVQRSTMMSWAMDELRAQGVPEANAKAAAAHLVGQAEMESGLNPSLSHDSGTGYGIYGARLDRRAHMLDWMTQNGYSPSSPEGQMRYMAREAMSGQYPRTRAVLMGANETGFMPDSRAITAEFERPAIINNRAPAVYAAYGTNAPANALAWGGGERVQQNGLSGAYPGQHAQNSLAYYPDPNDSGIPLVNQLAPPPSLRVRPLVGIS